MRGRTTFAILACAAVCAAAEEAAPRAELIGGLKEFAGDLGFAKTENFRTHAPETRAHYRCYYTDKLKLPQSYEGLRLAAGSEAGCSIDERKYDVFFYPIEAVASGQATVTRSLGEASEERAAVVVAHEEAHETLLRLPPAVAEAASTLLGFVTAAEYARARFGESSELHRNLAKEAELFQRKAEIVRSYHARLRRLYDSAGRSRASKARAIVRKRELFAELERECLAISPEPHSFNRCPAVSNNAGLAFDMTYAGYYSRVYELWVSSGGDLRGFVEVLKGWKRLPRLSDAVE